MKAVLTEMAGCYQSDDGFYCKNDGRYLKAHGVHLENDDYYQENDGLTPEMPGPNMMTVFVPVRDDTLPSRRCCLIITVVLFTAPSSIG